MTSSTQAYSGELRDTAITSINIQKAFQHRSNIDAIEARVRSGELSEINGARPCLKECTAGIDLLKAGSALGSREVVSATLETCWLPEHDNEGRFEPHRYFGS